MTRSHERGEAPEIGGSGTGRRRGLLPVVVAVAVIAGLAFAPPTAAQDTGEGLLPPGDWTAEQEAYLLDLIERTEAALPAFADVDALPALGFQDFGVTAPGGYDHWTNQAWIDDEHILDPEFPESLVFRHTPEGGYVLEAAMFFLPSEYDLSTIPEDLAWMPGWHEHPELCVNPDGTFAGLADVDGTCFSGTPSEMPPMMHVWLVANACGHRFGGVGIGGLDCDVDHEHPPTDPHDPMDPHEPTDPQHPTDPHDPADPHHPPGMVDPHGDPGGHGHDPGAHPVAPAAHPVHAHPDYAG